MASAVPPSLEERLLEASSRLLAEHGAAALTVRAVAESAGSSTMGVYTCFGGRTGLLQALYLRGFVHLQADLIASRDATQGDPPADRILALTLAYRDFGLTNPPLYGLMFERPMPDFDPSPELRSQALAMAFTVLLELVASTGLDPLHPAYLIWTTAHGLVSIELTHSVRSPLPGWFVDSPEAGRAVLREGIKALLSALLPAG